MAEKTLTKTDLAEVSNKVDAVAVVVDDVQQKTKRLQKSADIKAEDWDMLVEIKAEEIKTQALFNELMGKLDQQTRDLKEEVRVAVDKIISELHATLDKKKVIRFNPPSWWARIKTALIGH